MAKARRVRGYAQQFESLGRISGQISNLWVLGMPLTELQREYDATVKQTLDQVLAAEKKYVSPRHRPCCSWATAPRSEGLKALNLGDVVLLDAEGGRGRRTSSGVPGSGVPGSGFRDSPIGVTRVTA